MSDVDVVPFGKYRGQPVELLLADRSYCQWLAAQPWFRDRFAPVYNIIIGSGGEPQDSPEHNAMQARFLDHAQALRLAEPWLPTGDALHEAWVRDYGRRLTTAQRANLALGDHRYEVTKLPFEHGGWDVVVEARAVLSVSEVSTALECICSCTESCTRNAAMGQHEGPRGRERHCADDCPVTWVKQQDWTVYQEARKPGWVNVAVAVELKPVVGDDYPTVLRQVLRRRAADHRIGRPMVLADRAEFASVTLAQVRAIFASQGVTFLTADELAPALPCSCAHCAPTSLVQKGES